MELIKWEDNMSIDTHIYIIYHQLPTGAALGMNHPGTLATTVPRGCHGSSFPLKRCVTDDAGVNGFTWKISGRKLCEVVFCRLSNSKTWPLALCSLYQATGSHWRP